MTRKGQQTKQMKIRVFCFFVFFPSVSEQCGSSGRCMLSESRGIDLKSHHEALRCGGFLFGVDLSPSSYSCCVFFFRVCVFRKGHECCPPHPAGVGGGSGRARGEDQEPHHPVGAIPPVRFAGKHRKKATNGGVRVRININSFDMY